MKPFFCAAVAVGCLSFTPMVVAADKSQPARPAFIPAGDGGFQFDTGVLRGKLRPGGKARGLSSVVHVPTGIALDRGDKGYGLFSHYRVFTAGKRYGGGAWDWPGEARLLPDGAVEVLWPEAEDRPFQMRAVYRWAAPNALDLETIVQPTKDLERFESFLASYLQEPFTNALTCVSDHPRGSGKTGFMAAEKGLGDWQMYPRDAAVLPLIKDGRWQLPPNPVQWTITPPLAQPICLRRDAKSGLAVVLMAPAEDCFAIAMPHQAEGHYSLYLSLFGLDLKAGKTARARARLLVASGLSDSQILDHYATYVQGLGQKP